MLKKKPAPKPDKAKFTVEPKKVQLYNRRTHRLEWVSPIDVDNDKG